MTVAEAAAEGAAPPPEAPPAPRRPGNRKSFSSLIIDAVVAAFIAFALAGPIIGLRTETAVGGLSLTQNWIPVAIIVAVVFAGRLLLNVFVWQAINPVTRSFAKLGSTEPLTRRDWTVILSFTAIPAVVLVASLVANGVSWGDRQIIPDLVARFGSDGPAWLGTLFAYLAPGSVRLIAGGLVAIVAGALLHKATVALIPNLPLARLIGGIAILLALLLPVIVLLMPAGFPARYVLDQAIVILTYVMLGWGLNIVVGYAGMLDLGYVAFYAVGAYSFALLSHYFDLSFWICLPLAGLLAACWGFILGFPVLRLRGDYLAIVTLAFGEIIRVILINWTDFTGGPNGINNVPRPTLFGIPFERGEGGFAATFGLPFSSLQRIIFLYYIILILAVITSFVTSRLRRLPLGRAWEALREDEIACRSLGINTTNTKLTAFTIGAFFAGLAGSFFATRQGFISPESFTAMESFVILAAVVLGGLGSQLGIVIAVIFLNTVFELRELEQYRMLIVGMAMVLIMIWRPRGLISTRRPTVRLAAPPGAPLAVAGGRA